MKRKISKAEYEALSPEMKIAYVADGDGYKLPLIDDDDPDALRRARDREKEDARVAKEALAVLQAKIDALDTDTARKSGDIATLETSWKNKLTTRETELNAVIASQKEFIKKTLVDHAASKVAASITAKPEHADLMKPHISSRFEVVFDGDQPTVRIKDKDGRISAMNFDELQKELIANPTFGTIVVSSKASGGGASGHGIETSSGGAGKKLKEMSETDRVSLFKFDPVEYKRRRAAEGM